MKVHTCAGCGGSELYQSKPVSAGGGYAPNYLPGLGGWVMAAKFRLVVCRSCGLTMFFAGEDALAKLPESDDWTRLT